MSVTMRFTPPAQTDAEAGTQQDNHRSQQITAEGFVHDLLHTQLNASLPELSSWKPSPSRIYLIPSFKE